MQSNSMTTVDSSMTPTPSSDLQETVNQRKRKISFILESRPKNNKKICSDKYSFYEHDIPNTELSKTLVQESTSDAKDLKPFWNSQCKEISAKLSLPTEIVSAELGLNLLNGSSKKTADALSLSVIVPTTIKKSTGEKISLPSLPYLPPGNTGVVNTVKEKLPKKSKLPLKTIRYKLKLTSSQKYVLYDVCSKLRALENEMRAFVNTKAGKTDAIELRKMFVSKNATGISDAKKRARIETLHYETRDAVARRVSGNNKARIANEENGNNKSGGKFKFRSFKDEVKNGFTIDLPAKAISTESITKQVERGQMTYRLHISPMFKLTPMKLKLTKKERRSFIPDPKRHGLKLSRDPFGNFFVFISYAETEIPENESSPIRQLSPPIYKDVSLDPGARDILTGYTADGGFAFTLNFLDRKKVKRIERERDKYRSLYDTETNPMKKYRYYNLWKLRIAKLKNLAIHFRRHARRFLTENFQEISIGFFNGSFVMTGPNKETKKALSNIGHYKFRHFLYEASKHRLISTIHEAYTSQTCCQCGKLNHKLGRSKTFNCVSGCVSLDRDVNAAINIGIKNADMQARKQQRKQRKNKV